MRVMTTQSTLTTNPSGPRYLRPFLMVTSLFFFFGFVTTLNMALVPHLRSVFNLDYAWAMLADSSFFLAYFAFSAPTSKLIDTLGYKQTMVISLFVQVIGCLLFIPAAKFVNFPLFLSAVFILGAGVTALQTSANPYVIVLGPEHSSPMRLTLAQAFNSIGATIAPLVAGAFILIDAPRMVAKAKIAATVCIPYLVIAGALSLLGLIVAFMHLPHINSTSALQPGEENDAAIHRSIWAYRHTLLGALGIFLYVGVEVGLASIAVNYFKSEGMSSEKAASFLLSLYWFGALAGRLAGTYILTKVRSGQLLGATGVAAALLLGTSMVAHGQIAIWTLVLCGLFNSIMFPNIFALGVAHLGALTGKGSGLIMTACVGGAVIPFLIGVLADKVGIQHALILPIFCYLFIAYYGFSGSELRQNISYARLDVS